MALDWKATLPEKPNPECISPSNPAPNSGAPKKAGKAVSAADRAKSFDRWDTNKDGVLTLDE
jgi:hypothetical protein